MNWAKKLKPITSNVSETLEFPSQGRPDIIETLSLTGVVADTPTMEVDAGSNSKVHSPLPARKEEEMMDGVEMTSSDKTPSEATLKRARLICDEFAKAHAGFTCSMFLDLLTESQPKLTAERKRLKERLEEQLWAAACLRDYQLTCVQKAFELEVEQIEREFEQERSSLKEKLLSDLFEHRRRLTESKETAEDQNGINPITGSLLGGVDTVSQGQSISATAKATQRKLRGKRSGGDVNEQKSTQRVSTGLGEAEIYDDLVLILKDDNSVLGGRRTRQTAQQPVPRSSDIDEEEAASEVTVRGDSVYCFGQSFTRGDNISISTPDQSELIGVITGVGSKDVWIRIDDGAKLKITYQQLKNGRYALAHVDQSS